MSRSASIPFLVDAPPATLPRLINAVAGHALERFGASLAQPMAFHDDGRRVAGTPRALAALLARQGDSPLVCVFVHGFTCDETAWARDCPHGSPRYDAALRETFGANCLHVRYNTGRSVRENGRSLARLLSALARADARHARRLVLIGHSMGGLVARAAAAHAAARRHRWLERLCMIICLGTPHRGAPLPRAAGTVPALAGVLATLSAGMVDLRQSLHRRLAHPRLDRVAHRFLAARWTEAGSESLADWFGDGLVSCASAAPPPPRPNADYRTATVDGVHHLALLRHPRVRAQLEAWVGELGPRPAKAVRLVA